MAVPPPPPKVRKRCFPGLTVVNNSLFVPLSQFQQRGGGQMSHHEAGLGWEAEAPQTPAFEVGKASSGGRPSETAADPCSPIH